MRLLFVVPGGGRLVPELAPWCGEFLTRLGDRDHEVEVLTTEGGALDGALDDTITVHRLPTGPGDRDLVALVNTCMDVGATPRLDLQEAWVSALGPPADGLEGWLQQRGPDFDAVAFVDAASQPARSGLTALAGVVPTVLHALAADDAGFRFGVFDSVLRQATALGFVDQAEANLVRPRAGRRPTGAVVGCGVDLEAVEAGVGGGPGVDLGERPYLLVGAGTAAGRERVIRYFSAYKTRHRGSLRLILAGGEAGWEREPRDESDVIPVAFVDRVGRVAAIRGAAAVIEPRGIDPLPVLWAEAGACCRPCLVATDRPGQLYPRPGALGFGDVTEFAAAVELLTADGADGDSREARAALGGEGRRFVELHCRWDDLLARYERLLHVIQSRR